MNLKELLEARYSVRAYLPKEVEQDKLDYILECGRLAPSACNLQPWYFYVAASEEGRSFVQASYPRDWFKTAPLYLVVCVDHSQSWKRSGDGKDHAGIDASIAVELLSLAAESLGLGTCWVCNFNPAVLSNSLLLPGHIEPVAILSVGYIDEQNSKVPEKKRKPVSEIATRL